MTSIGEYAFWKCSRLVSASAMGVPFTDLQPIASITLSAASIGLVIPTAPGREIGVEFSRDLSAGSWIDLGNFESVGVGEQTFTDTGASRVAGPRGLYRAFLRPIGN